MSRKQRGRDVHGIVLLDKPAGISSNQALQKVRRLFDARKAGHTGSLDPFATGMLPLCFGEATKTAAFMLGADKGYRAGAVLGAATATGDKEGETVRTMPVPDCPAAEVDRVLQAFRGEIEQVPPMYSALKHGGQPLYRLARQGVRVKRKPRRVRIHRIALVDWNPPRLDFEVHCSKGTYVRTLAEDIAARLGSCAHLVFLRRLHVGGFDPADMVSLVELEAAVEEGRLENRLLPVDAGLTDWPRVTLDAQAASGFLHGNPQSAAGRAAGKARVYGPGDHILGLGEIESSGTLRPRRVFHIGAV
jgi:tRNA pseudouridine55 synthase